MTRYVVSTDAACAVLEDGVVVLHMGTKRYYSLNDTGATIWRMLEESVAIEQMAARLVELYDVDGTTADHAVTRLIDDLREETLISAETA